MLSYDPDGLNVDIIRQDHHDNN
jgi:hypothetical protein